MHDVLVIGAGAAGLTTAIFTRRFNCSQSVLILDAARMPGAKILISGGSRCNVTNAVVTERDFHGGRAAVIRRLLRTFSASDAVRFFHGLGVALHEEADGKLFPDTNRARDVLRALLDEIAARGVELRPGYRVLDVIRTASGFTVNTAGGAFQARAVVLATGGRSLPKSGSDGGGYELARALGHTIVPTTPALVPLLLDPSSIHRRLAGVSHEVELTVWIDDAVAVRLSGSLLWTHFGISGPAALDASRHWTRARAENRSVALTANLCPGESFESIDEGLLEAAASSPNTSALKFVSRFVPVSVGTAVLSAIGADLAQPLAHLPRETRRRIARAMVEWPLPINGTRGYNFAEVTAGGVALDEVDPSTMESRVCPGLFLVGEILDVDGRLGGFNFQWAWSTAFVAGRALARA